MDLYYPVVFCKDGILRVYNENKNTAIVATDVSAEMGYSPSKFLFRILNNRVILEEGSTLSTFLKCLEPWVDDVSALTDRDVQSYLTAIKRPTAAENAYDRIEMRARASVSRQIIREKYDGDSMSFMDYINSPVTFSPNKFTLGMVWDICGYVNGQSENWSVSSTSIHKIKNVPLVINREWVFSFSRHTRDEHGPVLDFNASGVVTVTEGKFGYIKCDIDGDVDWTFKTMVEAVICHGLWYHTPSAAESSADEIAEIMANLGDLSQLDDDEDLDEDPDDDEEQEEDGQPPIKRIIVADGAFSGIIESSKRQECEWTLLTNRVKSPVRVGSFKEDLPQDDRMMGMFLG